MCESACMYNEDILSMITEYHGEDSYMYMGTLSRYHRAQWGIGPCWSGPALKRARVHRSLSVPSRKPRTSIYHATGSESRLQEFQEENEVNVKTVSSMIKICAKKGDVGSLENVDRWALSTGLRVGGMRCPETMKSAALSRNIRAMEWCVTRGFCMNSDVMAAAASTGRLDSVRWLIDNKCGFGSIVTEEAAAQGSMKMVRFLTRMYPYTSGKSSAVSYAARNGHMDVVAYLVRKGYPVCNMAAGFAALGGNLGILKYLHAKGYPLYTNVCYMAAMKGSLEILSWARDNGYPWDKWTMRMALKRNRADVVRYVVENGCPDT